jgi:hypothetical protein
MLLADDRPGPNRLNTWASKARVLFDIVNIAGGSGQTPRKPAQRNAQAELWANQPNGQDQFCEDQKLIPLCAPPHGRAIQFLG